MGLLDWFKGVSRGEAEAAPPPPPSAATEREAEVAGLNFKTAVDAHMKWKVRLESYINGTSTEELLVESVCRDDQCLLGKWIYGKGGEKFGFSETFFDVKTHHAQFHRCAGSVLAAAQAGNKDQAMSLLRGGDYMRSSERVKMLLARMFVIASEGREAIDTHVRWKERLRAHIQGTGHEDLQAETVSRDDQCTLGQWIKGIGRERFGGTNAFDQLIARHTEFHRAAGEVLRMAAQDKAVALRMLDAGAYPEASTRVTEAIVELFEEK